MKPKGATRRMVAIAATFVLIAAACDGSSESPSGGESGEGAGNAADAGREVVDEPDPEYGG